MLHQWFTCVHLLDTYLANLKEGFQLSFYYPSVSIRAAQSGLQSVPAYRMRWGCHHLFRSYDGNPSNIANIRLHSVSGHTISLAKIRHLSDIRKKKSNYFRLVVHFSSCVTMLQRYSKKSPYPTPPKILFIFIYIYINIKVIFRI